MADNSLFTFASLTRPSGRGVLSAVSPFVVVAWVTAKNVALTLIEMVKEGLRWTRSRRTERGWRWLKLKILMSIWVRNFFTMAVSRDLYEGVPAIYVNYLGYDEMAHAFGPRSDRALQALRDVDEALEQLWTVMRRVPEHRYDAYVLSDHGQSACTSYDELTQGKRLERCIFDEFLHPEGAGDPDAPGTDGEGPVCWRRGTPCRPSVEAPGPFSGRNDAALVVEGIATLMRMRSAGDLVIYGSDAPEGYVSFIREYGAHAGPGATEMHTFIVRPARVTLPAEITHPAQLYDHFIGYLSAARARSAR